MEERRAAFKARLPPSAVWTTYSNVFSENLSPPFWDTPSCAYTLSCSFSLACDLRINKSISKPQAEVYNNFVNSLFPASWPLFLNQRLITALAIPAELVYSINWTDAFLAMRPFPPHVRMILVRTWVNAWTTTTRMHERDIVSCFCGCSAPDSLAHYIVCPRLWRAVCSSCSEPLCIDPLSAISLPHPSFVSVRLSSVAFVLYHKFKGEYTAEFGDPSRNIQRTAALVKSVAASARRSVDLWLAGVGTTQESVYRRRAPRSV